MVKEYILNGQRIYIKWAFNIIYFGKLICKGTHHIKKSILKTWRFEEIIVYLNLKTKAKVLW